MMRNAARVIPVILISAVALHGCAIGYQFNYAEAEPTIRTNPKIVVAVGFQDRRPAIVSQKKPPDYVGVLRSSLGIPYSVTTESERPMADDMATAVAGAIERDGGKAIALSIAPTASMAEIVRDAKVRGAGTCMVFTLRDWQTDTYMSTNLVYDVAVDVFDADGKITASNKIKGEDNLGFSFINPRGHAYYAVEDAFKSKIGVLVSGDVAKALK
ncbi:hypothetical protein [Methylococcus capsulatus]|jgi:hypothetical protein|uniref:Uncharacterized protein n=1 Tax=Methylococcus capsulatus TaxID=414 RepID=A0AA35UXV1_METCP|nr:hypothetical protein [Methylococcus capsulatus]CAI8753532.1 conserved protein of unknown function [Methylococcus capsulatus]